MNHELALPDGKRIRIDDSVRGRFLGGVLAVDDAVVAEAPEVWHETAALAATLRARHAGRLPSEIPGLQEARDLYKAFNMEPTRHRPSSEALLRRVLKGEDLYRISSAVDLGNLASLSFLLPIGMYDRDLVAGDVTVRTGREGEEYPGIRKGPVHLDGRLGLFDDAGPFGSPTSDSARTCVTATTSRVLAVIMATPGYDGAAMLAHVDLLADLFCRHCRATVTLRGILGG